jgi:hypothetical protein
MTHGKTSQQSTDSDYIPNVDGDVDVVEPSAGGKSKYIFFTTFTYILT